MRQGNDNARLVRTSTFKAKPRIRALKWTQRKAWSRTLFTLLDDKLDGAVLAEIRRRDPENLLDDDFSWLNESVVTIKGSVQEDIPARFAIRLAEFYDGVVAFHGCRPLSLDSYKINGLKPSDTEAIRLQAKELFGDTAALHKAILDVGPNYENHNRGVVWMCLAKESFLRGRQHDGYLLHGSEYLAAIAHRIGQTDKLRNLGVPTIIECFVCRSQLPPGFWLSLSRTLIEDWFARYLWPDRKRPVNTSCINVKTTIPAHRILKFHQFDEIRRLYWWGDFQTGERKKAEAVHFRPRPAI